MANSTTADHLVKHCPGFNKFLCPGKLDTCKVSFNRKELKSHIRKKHRKTTGDVTRLASVHFGSFVMMKMSQGIAPHEVQRSWLTEKRKASDDKDATDQPPRKMPRRIDEVMRDEDESYESEDVMACQASVNGKWHEAVPYLDKTEKKWRALPIDKSISLNDPDHDAERKACEAKGIPFSFECDFDNGHAQDVNMLIACDQFIRLWKEMMKSSVVLFRHLDCQGKLSPWRIGTVIDRPDPNLLQIRVAYLPHDSGYYMTAYLTPHDPVLCLY